MTAIRKVSLPDELDAALSLEAAKRSKKEKRPVTVQELMIEATAKVYGVEITIRTRGQRGPGKKGKGE